MPDVPATALAHDSALVRAAAASASGGTVAARADTMPAQTAGGSVLLPARALGRVRRRWRVSPAMLSLFAMVLLPTLVGAGYFGFIASNRYVSEFRVAVRTISPMKTDGMSALMGLAGMSQSSNDSNAVVQYLQSREALEAIDQSVGLRTHYAAPAVDVLSRMRDGGTVESFLRFWRRQLDASYETSTGTVVVSISAFDPATALAAATSALQSSEDLVNRMSTRARNDTVAFSTEEVAKAEARLASVNVRLRSLRDQEKILDPRKTAESTLGLAAKFKEEIARLNAELSVQRTYLDENSPSVVGTRDRVLGLQRELDKIGSETTASQTPDSKPLSGVLGAFDQLDSERQFAEKSYQSALASLEAARMDATRQQVYLATIVRPELPQEASFPRPIRNTATVFGVALLLWLVALLSVFAVKEHL